MDLLELINGMKAELHRLRGFRQVLESLDLPALRRDVAFYIHPDRGGDLRVSQEFNALMDALE